MQETLCTANTTHLSAAGGQGWALATQLATDKKTHKVIVKESINVILKPKKIFLKDKIIIHKMLGWTFRNCDV